MKWLRDLLDAVLLAAECLALAIATAWDRRGVPREDWEDQWYV